MCGIVGFASHQGRRPNEAIQLFSELLYHDSIRGYDSTGMGLVVGKKKIIVDKAAQTGADYIRSDKYRSLMHKYGNAIRLAVGHNRAATQGDVTDDNAHPFMTHQLFGVHNGTVTNFGKYNNDPVILNSHVDSEKLYILITEYGLQDVLTEVHGSYALVWYDFTNKTLNFIRNADRPLSIFKIDDGPLVWASEEAMLSWLLRRKKIFQYKAVSLPVDTHLSFALNDMGRVTEKRIVLQYNYYSSYNSGYNSRSNYTQKKHIPFIPTNDKKTIIHGTGNNWRGNDYLDAGKSCKFIESGKSYTFKINETQLCNGGIVIKGKMDEEPWMAISVRHGNSSDYNRLQHYDLIAPFRYIDNKTQEAVCYIDDVQIYNPGNSKKSNVTFLTGPHGVKVTVEELDHYLQGGCLCCNKLLDHKDANNVYWTEDEIPRPVCDECITSWNSELDKQIKDIGM